MATVPEYTGFVPARNQAQDVFNTNMAQYFSYIANLAPAINTTAQEINDTAVTVAQTTAEEAAARTATEVEAELSVYVNDASGYATDAANSATLASNLADATAANTETYTSVSAGLAATVDTNYFRVIEAPEAERVSVYRNDAGSATLITTYYTKTGVDAKQAAAVRLNRSLQRLGDNGQTLHSDFNLAGYGLGSQLYGGVQEGYDAEELWDVQRATPKYVLQHTADGSIKYVEVPVDTLAREWNPETGEYAALIEGSATNELRWSSDLSNSVWSKISTWTYTHGATDVPTPFLDTSIKITKAVRAANGDSLIVRQLGLTISANDTKSASVLVYFPSGQSVANPTISFDFILQSRITRSIDKFDQWVRFDVPMISSGEDTGIDVGLSDGGNDNTPIGTTVYIAAPQLETGTRATSPIITTDAPKTRAGDSVLNLSDNNITGLIGTGGEFTLSLSVKGCDRIGNTENVIRIGPLVGFDANGSIRLRQITSGGATYFDFIVRSVSGETLLDGYNFNNNGKFNNLAISYRPKTRRVVVVGDGVVRHDIELDENPFSGVESFYWNSLASTMCADFSNIRLLPTALTAAQLQELTAL